MSKGWNIAEFSIIAKNRQHKTIKSRKKLYYKFNELSVCETIEEAMKCFCVCLNELEETKKWGDPFFWKINGDKIECYSGEELCETYYDIKFKSEP